MARYTSKHDLEDIVKLKLDNSDMPDRYSVTGIMFPLNGSYKLMISNGLDTIEVFPSQVVILEKAYEKNN